MVSCHPSQYTSSTISADEKDAHEPQPKRSKLDPFLSSLLRASYQDSEASDDTEDESGENTAEEVERFLTGKNLDYSSDPLAWWRVQASSFHAWLF